MNKYELADRIVAIILILNYCALIIAIAQLISNN